MSLCYSISMVAAAQKGARKPRQKRADLLDASADAIIAQNVDSSAQTSSEEASSAPTVTGEAKGSVDIPVSFVDFCARFRGPDHQLETGQRVLCSVLFDRVDPIDVDDPDERGRALRMFGCERVPATVRALGIVLAVCGARSGKTSMFAWRAVHRALTIPLKLMAGEEAFVPIVGPRTEDVAPTLGFAEGCARIVAPGRVSEDSSKGFTLTRFDGQRVRFAVFPAASKGGSTRGRVFPVAILDEAALFRGDDSVVNDRDVINSITPRIPEGGELLIPTTPWAKIGAVWGYFSENFGKPTTALVAHAPTVEMRTDARILLQVQNEYGRDAWNAAREFGAVFSEQDQGAFFEHDALEACIA